MLRALRLFQQIQDERYADSLRQTATNNNMFVTKLSKTFHSGDCAAMCEIKVKGLLATQLLRPIVKDFYRDANIIFIEFLPETTAIDSDYLTAYMDGFESGFIAKNKLI